ncbi:MAG TPA: LysM peptidoglycan-binding domain-containing protein [Candidatus Kapabacteria bacterium]|nr:LysM peptidoglycan-binding domain-containing protein [Candidatus Kapabacteria bacterium]HPO62454.1 LysM peptidoglycan-binding domain-containing protein [Candidatus Kapabacteria bacterium]
MKKNLILCLLFIFACSFSNELFAQKQDQELTKDEAVIRIQEFQNKVKTLQEQLANLDGDIEKLQKELEQVIADLKNCKESLYSMIGATPEQVEKYRQQVGVLEGKISAMKRLSDKQLAEKENDILALENEYLALRDNKIALLPDIYNKLVQMGKDIRNLYRTAKVTTYTVGTWAKDKDCLWNIAGKIEIFSDPFLWPKIWQSNTDIIKDPDIIFPGQVLKLPAKADKTSDEIKAERKYWRNKRAAMEQKKAAEQSSTTQPTTPEQGKKGN